MYEFNYYRPTSLEEAKKLYNSAEGAEYLAGGQTILPTLKHRLSKPTGLIDLVSIPDLDFIAQEKNTVLVGAATRHADVASSVEVQSSIKALSYLASCIGDPQVRNIGTIGGSIANNDPAADYPAAIVGLDATIITDRREILSDDFFVDMFETSLETSEIIKAVRFEAPLKAGYAKFPNPASRYAIVGVFVAETSAGVRVAITGAGPCVFRAEAFEKLLGDKLREDVEFPIIPYEDLNSDIHASAEYRSHLISVMTKRAIAFALA